METSLAGLAAELVRLDSRSSVSNLSVAERIEAELHGFEVERLDYTDAQGVPKRALVAHRGGPGGIALSGHMDTVPETGWTDDPWSGAVRDGVLHGLGSCDMKGPVAACILAAQAAPRATLLITADEETTKGGARVIAERSELARAAKLRGIVVAEPTELVPVRGHRSHIAFTATARGVQAHSSTGRGVNANWALIPFLAELREIHAMLREDPAWHDEAYDPPFSDFNLVVDNHGTAVNVSVPLATARVKFRYSHRLDPSPLLSRMEAAARSAGVELEIAREGLPPELPVEHPLVRQAVRLTGRAPSTVPFGTDASILQDVAPCVILGPGSIALAHTPREHVPLAALEAARELYLRLLNDNDTETA
ncbi:M20/M25/M40 family metallo-hydrolase [Sabulicella rubraurantiaca]|uniref:M20/M25/M40 family metallo-hydrolase n=1 Tax=Sabulicella rubraurantiaca TaxID=2811429 RepID=UPI001A9718D8|nr:M20/M25/M40 family metallo-hydrolase [Sabulicella rubraurantiaca]